MPGWLKWTGIGCGGLIVMAMLVACGGSESGERPRTVIKTVEETVVTEKTVDPESREQESTSGYVPLDPAEQREADAAKAAAAEEEITLQELRRIDTSTAYGEQLVLGLGNCQLNKYAAENGQAALDEFSAQFVDEVAAAPEGEEVVSIQEKLLMEGYSCTTQEAMSYSTGG